MVLVMMVLNYIALAKLSDYRYKLLGSDLETILKMSDKHRYLVNEKTFALEGMSDGLIYQYGKGALGKKCHKVFFNSDFVCKDCPLLSGQSGDTPVVYMKEKFLRKRLSYQTPDNIASLLLEPYNPNDELRKSVIRFDPVTCLSSRASFNETVTNLVIGKAKGSLLLIILEGVNEIITNYGETNLNNILIEMRKRIMDSDNAERIYRYDDSVLAIYFDGVTRIQLYDLMENIHALIKTPYAIEGRMIKCNYRYSEINFNGTFATSGEVFALIDKGLMTARKGMDNNLTIPNETITRVASKSDYIISLMEENFLNKAVEFRIQPIVKIKDGSIKYGEILLRLYDVLREKMLSPLEVVTIASDAKKMGKFDSLNYETAIGLYNKYGAGVFRIYAYSGFSINLSSDSLESNEWLSRLKRFIEANPCPEGYLGVEIPERSFSDNQGRIKIWFNELRGYHLNWLVDNYDDSVITPREASELGFKTLKLSRKFLMDALADPIAKGLFESVVREAHYNGLTVVAQGVESKEQFDFCKTAGADYIQGFYLYSPLKIEEFLTALQEKPDKKKLGLESAAGIPEKVIPAQEQIKTKKTFKERREEKKNAKLLKKADKAKEKAAEEIEAQ
jgi:EAL domain-containing protein (putative c-di-GMP-specific phosphodiesterase class I)/GGDEF domain-containing protein